MGLVSSLVNPKAEQLPAEFRGPVAWLQETGGVGRESAAGIRVTSGRAISCPAVFACVRAIAEDVSKLPMPLYRRLQPKGKEKAIEDERYWMLMLEPNPEMSAFDFTQAMLVSAVLWGNGYAEIERNGAGDPVAVWPILPSRATPKRDSNKALYYEVTDERGMDPYPVQARNIIHLKGLGPSGLVGWLMPEVAAESIGLCIAAMRFTASFFAKGTSPPMIVKVPGKMDAEALKKYASALANRHSGENAHRPMVIDSGADVTTIAVDPESSQMIETLNFAVRDVARYFRVPPHKIGDLERATFSNIEHQSLEYVGDTMLPWLSRCTQEYNRKLLNPAERRQMFFEHMLDVLLRADIQARYGAYQIGIQNGILSRNEVRAKENMNPVEGGDQYMVPQNMAVLDEDGVPVPVSGSEPEPEPETPEQGEDGGPDVEQLKAYMMPVFVDVAERCVVREVKAVEGKLSKGAELDEWVSTFYEGHRGYMRSAFDPACRVLSRLCGADHGPVVDRFCDAHVSESRRWLLEADDKSAELTRWTAERPGFMARFLTDEVCNATSN